MNNKKSESKCSFSSTISKSSQEKLETQLLTILKMRLLIENTQYSDFELMDIIKNTLINIDLKNCDVNSNKFIDDLIENLKDGRPSYLNEINHKSYSLPSEIEIKNRRTIELGIINYIKL